MDKLKVIISNSQRLIKIPSGIRMLVRRACSAVLVMEEFVGPAEVNITFVDDEEIKRLNNQFRNIDAATDVLSFPLGEDGIYDVNPESGAKMLGDVIVSVPHAIVQAEEYGHSLQREMAFLTVHSILHLLGYDHVNGGLEAVKMREKEERVLIQLGVPRTSSYSLEE